ncbi:hypothetical protein B4U80_12760 [Leptotrombidium deliense]|uniref:Uncharacterized protein n=1 Tax=Leptotrombidium deliense TaxID=299467 RepID=A0A443SN65_9ACAR|nr:hypothetical protein B4U80_12760 [Leptotrombidium deliense]
MGTSNQLFSEILMDLNEIEKQEKEINSKLNETRKELDYIDGLIHKYEEIRVSLLTKMTSLQNQKDTCSQKRRKVVQRMNTKLNNETPPSTNNGVEYSKFDCLKITDTVTSQHLDKKDDVDDESKALDHLVAEILKTLNDGANSHELTATSTPIGTETNSIKGETKYSNGGGVHLNPLTALKSLRIEDSFFESSSLPEKEATTFAEKVSCNNSAASLEEVAVEVSVDNGHSNSEINYMDDEWMSSVSPSNSSQAPRFYTKTTPAVHHKTQYNSVLCLEASVTGYIYKSLNDGTVMRYRFANVNDNRYYRGHTDKVKVLYLDSKLQLLYTGCDDGKVRSFNTNTGSLLNEFSCDGNVIAIEKCFDSSFIFGTNKGWIYLVNSQFELQTSHRTFNWIFAVKGVMNSEKDIQKKLIVVPMKHKPSVIDAVSGKVLQEMHSDVIESRPCIQVNGTICILATVFDKTEPGKSSISVFDSNNVSIYFFIDLVMCALKNIACLTPQN